MAAIPKSRELSFYCPHCMKRVTVGRVTVTTVVEGRAPDGRAIVVTVSVDRDAAALARQGVYVHHRQHEQ